MNFSPIHEAKERLRLPELWRMLQLSGDPPAKGKGACCSPFRPDRSPSFSIFDEGRRWKDFATGDGGDAVHFLMQAQGCEKREAIRQFLELAGVRTPRSAPVNVRRRPRMPAIVFTKNEYNERRPDVSRLRRPGAEEMAIIAELRGLDPAAVRQAASWGILRCGLLYGTRCWALVDGPPGEAPCIAEVRRLDGQRIHSAGKPEGIKGLTLPGSRKDWPVAVSLLADPRARHAGVLLCEGMPDYLAAIHFARMAKRFDLLPVTILGRSVTSLHPAATALLSGRRIRIYPHADSDGGGLSAAERWALLLPGSRIDAFDFTGLLRKDGTPVNDLNDCTDLAVKTGRELWDLFPEKTGR